MNRIIISGSLFSIVLGLSGLAQAWNVAIQLWHVSPLYGQIIAVSATHRGSQGGVQLCVSLAQHPLP
jgi:hypothetical protein